MLKHETMGMCFNKVFDGRFICVRSSTVELAMLRQGFSVGKRWYFLASSWRTRWGESFGKVSGKGDWPTHFLSRPHSLSLALPLSPRPPPPVLFAEAEPLLLQEKSRFTSLSGLCWFAICCVAEPSGEFSLGQQSRLPTAPPTAPPHRPPPPPPASSLPILPANPWLPPSLWRPHGERWRPGLLALGSTTPMNYFPSYSTNAYGPETIHL